MVRWSSSISSVLIGIVAGLLFWSLAIIGVGAQSATPVAPPASQELPSTEDVVESELDDDETTTTLMRSLETSIMGVEAAGSGLSCEQVSPGDDILGEGEWIVFQCINPDSPQRNGEATSYYFQLHSLTAGWTWKYWRVAGPSQGDPSTNPNSYWASTKSAYPDRFFSESGVSTVIIALQAVPGVAQVGMGEMHFELLGGRRYTNDNQPYDPPRTATLSATYSEDPPPEPDPEPDPPACELDVVADTVSFSTVERGASGYPVATASLPITIRLRDDGDCAGAPDSWSLLAQGSDLDGPDNASIAAEHLVFESGAVIDGVSPEAGPFAFDTARVIAEGTQIPETSWSVALSLTPPADTPPGDYEGAITFEIRIDEPT